MLTIRSFSLFLLLLVQVTAVAQNTVKGKITDSRSQEPVPFANIIIYGTNTGTTSDINGTFEIRDVPYGFIKLQISCVGYAPKVTEDIYVTKDRINFTEVRLDPSTQLLNEIEVRGSQFVKKE